MGEADGAEEQTCVDVTSEQRPLWLISHFMFTCTNFMIKVHVSTLTSGVRFLQLHGQVGLGPRPARPGPAQLL